MNIIHAKHGFRLYWWGGLSRLLYDGDEKIMLCDLIDEWRCRELLKTNNYKVCGAFVTVSGNKIIYIRNIENGYNFICSLTGNKKRELF